MRRMLGLLAIMAAGLGVLTLFVEPDGSSVAPSASALQGTSYTGWIIGLCMGLCVAWFGAIACRGLSGRLSGWLRRQGRRVAYLTLAGLFVGILLYL